MKQKKRKGKNVSVAYTQGGAPLKHFWNSLTKIEVTGSHE